MSKREIEIKTVLGREEAARYLQELAQCLAGGRIVVQRGAEYVELRPSGSLELTIEAAGKKDKEKVSLELAWRMEAAPQAGGCAFTISADATPPAEPGQPEAPSPEPPATAAAGSAGNEKDKAARGCRK